MSWIKRRVQVLGSLLVSLLLLAGIYLLYHDLYSLISLQRHVLERTAYTAAHLISTPSIETALETKDSQTPSDSQLQDRLFAIQTDLNISGSLLILDVREAAPRILASTKPGLKKNDLYLPPASMKVMTALSNATSSTQLYWKDNTFWLSSYSLVKGSDGQTLALIAVESQETAFLYRLIGYALHYLLLAIGLITIGGFLYLWSTSKTSRSLESAKNRYFTLFRESTDGILFLDDHGNILKANDSALVIFQELPENVVGRNLVSAKAGFSFIPLDTGKDILKNTIALGEKFKSKAKLVLKNEKIRYLSYSSFPLSEFRATVGAIVIFQDITQDIVREQELEYHQSQLREENRELQQQVITDPLTKCLNKQYLHHFLDWQNLRWLRFEGCSLLLLDMDNFKQINDSKGHPAGDLVLQNFAAFLRTFFRRGDKVIRYGGDEFIVLLPRTDLNSAQRIAKNLLEALAKESSRSFEGIGVSIGAAELQSQEEGKDWLLRADQALYEAKRAGKNVVFINDPTQLEILN